MGWRPATGRNPPIEAVEPAYPLGPRFAGPRQGLAGGRSLAPPRPPAGMDTLYHPVYSDLGVPINRYGATVCVSDRSGRFRSCPQLCPNKESTTFRRRGLTPVFERLFREAVERVGELVTDLLTGEVG